MMNTDEDRNPSREAIEEEAVAWVVCLRGRKPDCEPAELKAWLEESPQRRQAYVWAKHHFEASAVWTCNGFAPVTYLIMPPWLQRRAG